MSDSLLNLGEVHSTWSKHVKRSLFRRKKAEVQVKDDGISSDVPALYVAMKGAKAEAAWAKTVEYREKNAVDAVAREPQTSCAAVKKLYPHFLHGRSPQGDVVVFELLGKLDTSVLRDGTVDRTKIVRHFAFVHEHISAAFDGEETRVATVLDAGGLSRSHLSSHFYALLSAASETTDNLVPFRTRRVVVVNAPAFFKVVFAAVRAVLPKAVRDTVEFVGEASKAAVLADLCGSDLPPEYGGDGPALGDHVFEKDFAASVAHTLLPPAAPEPEAARPAK